MDKPSYEIDGISVVEEDVVQPLFFIPIHFWGVGVNSVNQCSETVDFEYHRMVAFKSRMLPVLIALFLTLVESFPSSWWWIRTSKKR